MKLKELQTKLNDRVKAFVGRKMEMSDFHRELKDLIEDDLKNFGGCTYYPWRISFLIEWFISSDLMKLEMDFKEDARYTFKTVVIIQDAKFKLVDDNYAELTVEEIATIKRREQTLNTISHNKEKIAQLKAEIEALEKGIQEGVFS